MSKRARKTGLIIASVAGLLGIADFILKWGILGHIGTAGAWLWNATVMFLFYSIPVWALLILIALFFVLGRLSVRSSSTADQVERVPQVEDVEQIDPDNPQHVYTSDRIWEVNWEWAWTPSGEVGEVEALCPRCQDEIGWGEIYPDRRMTTRVAGLVIGIEFLCSACGHSARARILDALEDAKREIRRRVRTGEWKGAKDRLGQPLLSKPAKS